MRLHRAKQPLSPDNATYGFATVEFLTRNQWPRATPNGVMFQSPLPRHHFPDDWIHMRVDLKFLNC